MKTPLIFKLILLLVLAWRLIITNKKSTKPSEKGYVNLWDLSVNEFRKPNREIEPREAIKRFYRDFVRENSNQNQLYFLCFLANKLQKHYSKRGIFRLFWYDQHLVVAFFQSLQLLKLENERKCFAKILTNLKTDSFRKVMNNEMPESNAFLETNQDFDQFYLEFDQMFDLDKYCKALVNQFYAD
jgi:hypothetical protein